MAHLEEEPRLTHPSPYILRTRITQELGELDTKQKEFDDSISRERLELTRLWNTSLPIHGLPNELLVQIFARCKRWQYLMLVCHHWRDALVSTPAFWRKIDLKQRIDWTKLCFSRSAAATIDIRVRHLHRHPLDVVYPHAHRFKTLRFEVEYGRYFHTALSLIFGDGMPLLEDLEFEVLGRTAREPSEDTNPHLASKGFPRLRTLVLSQTVAPQDPSLYAQLRRLSLSRCSHTLSFDGFLDALAASVQLEALAVHATLLHLSGEWAHHGPVPRRPPISLPRLRSIALTTHGMVHTSRFLAHLHLSPSVVVLIAGGFQESQHDIDFPSISAMLPPNRSATIPALALVNQIDLAGEGEDYEIRCEYPNCIAAPKDSVRPPLTLYINNVPAMTWDSFMVQGLDDIVECYGRSPLTCLTVNGNHGYATVVAWERVFRTFPLLEKLDIGGRTVSNVSKVFLGLHAASSNYSDSPVACPNLKNVRVEGLGTAATYEAMRECFRYRGDRGAILQALNLVSLFDVPNLTSELRLAFSDDLCKAVDYIHMKYSGSDEEQEESEGEM